MQVGDSTVMSPILWAGEQCCHFSIFGINVWVDSSDRSGCNFCGNSNFLVSSSIITLNSSVCAEVKEAVQCF